MSARTIEIRGRKVELAEAGTGETLVYLHGFADIHGAQAGWLPFHEALAERYRVIAPAHPGCAGSDEDPTIDTMTDVGFHYLEVLDALGLESFHLVGSCVGGWLAAELAVRHRERVKSLTLLGATGLFVSGAPIGDIFYVAQPEDGTTHGALRHMLFAKSDSPAGLALYPDPRGEVEDELLRYKMFRFAARVGFSPPYLYDRRLRDRLGRYTGPSLVVWGEEDHMVPPAHGRAYAEGLGDARLETVAGAGHSLAVERPDEVARLIGGFVG